MYLYFILVYFRDDKIQSKISRIIRIWRKRVVFDYSYTDILTVLLNVPIRKLHLADPVQEFKVMNLL